MVSPLARSTTRVGRSRSNSQGHRVTDAISPAALLAIMTLMNRGTSVGLLTMNTAAGGALMLTTMIDDFLRWAGAA